ncbi:hypothetical protein GCM10022403_006830 [Streptomyces coacervatus]|uniref:Uncharacterized protein n=1 Tax=Streptomyces coacervatus TaxID=647381 RepID=A0ABP7GT58_9ACTN
MGDLERFLTLERAPHGFGWALRDGPSRAAARSCRSRRRGSRHQQGPRREKRDDKTCTTPSLVTRPVETISKDTPRFCGLNRPASSVRCVAVRHDHHLGGPVAPARRQSEVRAPAGQDSPRPGTVYDTSPECTTHSAVLDVPGLGVGRQTGGWGAVAEWQTVNSYDHCWDSGDTHTARRIPPQAGCDSGGGIHESTAWLTKRGRWLSCSGGMTITDAIHRAVLKVPAAASPEAYSGTGRRACG